MRAGVVAKDPPDSRRVRRPEGGGAEEGSASPAPPISVGARPATGPRKASGSPASSIVTVAGARPSSTATAAATLCPGVAPAGSAGSLCAAPSAVSAIRGARKGLIAGTSPGAPTEAAVATRARRPASGREVSIGASPDAIPIDQPSSPPSAHAPPVAAVPTDASIRWLSTA